jgi:formylglycine-generating enzyme required for sulfatase activity
MKPTVSHLGLRWLGLVALSPLVILLLLRSLNDGTAAGAGVERRRPALLDCTGKDGVSAKKMRQAQAAWARYLGRKVEESVEIGKGVKMTFVLVPPGKFQMGSPADQKDRDEDETLHTVTLTRPFYLGKYEVTQAQYEALTGKNPSRFKGANLPVETVSWEEARAYAEKLTKKRGDKRVYRLPTEAEWEYTCRGGRSSSKPFGIGDGLSLSSREANFDGLRRPARSAPTWRMLWVCTTCMATSGSGAPTGTDRTRRGTLQTRPVLRRARTG